MVLSVEETHFFKRKETVRPNEHLTVSYTIFEPNEHLPLHFHNDPYIGIVLKGQYSEVGNGFEDTIEAGQLIFHPTMEPHENIIGPEGATILNFSISTEFWVVRGLEALKPTERMIIHDPRFVTYANNLNAAWKNKNRLSVLGIEGLSLSIINLFIELTVGEVANSTSLDNVEDYCKMHFREPLSVEQIANNFGENSEVLSRKFKQIYGETLSERIFRLRINEAEKRLLETHDALADIAIDVGFYDQSHFARHFKKWKGVSPGKYRRALSK